MRYGPAGGGREYPEELNDMRTRRGGLTRVGEDADFPFTAWARDNAYPYRPEWLPFLRQCGSTAEVFFVRPLLERADAVIDDTVCRAGVLEVTLQHEVRGYKTDILVCDGTTRLAVEVDGLAFHTRTAEQVSNDYLRQRRIVAKGYTVVRYMASEAFKQAPECWRQIDAILSARRVV